MTCDFGCIYERKKNINKFVLFLNEMRGYTSKIAQDVLECTTRAILCSATKQFVKNKLNFDFADASRARQLFLHICLITLFIGEQF